MPEDQKFEFINERIDSLEILVATNLNHANDKVLAVQQRLNSFEATIETLERPPPDLSDLYTALAKAQAEIVSAEASQKNTFFESNYSDLADCWDACREPLSTNELAVIQLPIPTEDGSICLKTILTHSSGQSVWTTMSMHPKDQQPQSIGSCLTYLRRYMLCAIVGVAQGGADDDGVAATAAPGSYERIIAEEVESITVLADDLFGAKGDAAVKRMLTTVFSTSELQITNVSDIPAGQAQQALNLLTNQRNREHNQAQAKDKKPKSSEKSSTKDENREPGSDDE